MHKSILLPSPPAAGSNEQVDQLNASFPSSASISSTSSSTLARSLLPHKHGHTHKLKSHPLYSLPAPTTPLALVELATSLIFTVPGPPMDELRNDILPKLYHEAYVHRVNCREIGMEGLLAVREDVFLQRFRTLRVRFKSSLMDQDGTATMQAAAVGLTFDVIATPAGGRKHEVEDKRTTAMSIVKIVDGRIAQSDVVVDTFPLHGKGGQELSCVVM